MSTALALIHDCALAAGVGTMLYAATVTIAAFTALLAPTRDDDAMPAPSSRSSSASAEATKTVPLVCEGTSDVRAHDFGSRQREPLTA